MTTPVNPKPFLTELTGKPVFVKLKWGMEYKVIIDCRGGAQGKARGELGFRVRARDVIIIM